MSRTGPCSIALTVLFGTLACGSDRTPPSAETRAEPSGRPTQPVDGGQVTAPTAEPNLPTLLVAAVGAANGGLGVETRVPVDLRLRLPDGDGPPSRVDHFVVRLPGGSTEGLVVDEASEKGPYRYTFARPGTSLIETCAEQSASNVEGITDRQRPTTYCAKTIVEATGAGPRRPGADVTAKVATPVELRPIKDPSVMPMGAQLPVRAYLRNAKMKGVELRAQLPDGTTRVATTDHTASAFFSLDVPGPWSVRYVASDDERNYVAELAFAVKGEAR